jgi:hypothetical protein
MGKSRPPGPNWARSGPCIIRKKTESAREFLVFPEGCWGDDRGAGQGGSGGLYLSHQERSRGTSRVLDGAWGSLPSEPLSGQIAIAGRHWADPRRFCGGCS